MSGSFVLIGMYTQVAVLFAIAALKFDMYADYWKNRAMTPIKAEMYFLYGFPIIILISLLFTGPGFFAIDWPL